MWIREGHGSTRNSSNISGQKQVISRKKKGLHRFARDSIGNSGGFSGLKQVISKKKRKRSSPILRGIFRPKSEIQAVFATENKCSTKNNKKKRHEIRCQSTKNTNLGLDLHSRSPEPVNSSGHSPRLGGTSSHLGGHGPGMPPVAPGLSWSMLLCVTS